VRAVAVQPDPGRAQRRRDAAQSDLIRVLTHEIMTR
jgi:hypothetical protein